MFPGSPAFAICDSTSDVFLGECSGYQKENVDQSGVYRSYAVYGDAVLSLAETFNLTGGMRASLDEKNFSYSAPLLLNVTITLLGYSTSETVKLGDDWISFQLRLVLDYSLTEDILAYSSVSRGFKPGGFDPTVSAELSKFKPETAWAFEAGVKSTLSDQRAVFNAAVYYQDYKDFQTQVIRNGIASTINLPKVEGYGLELEFQARPSRSLLLMASASVSRSTIGTFETDSGNLSGNATIRSPEFMASFIAQYDFGQARDWRYFIRGEANYESMQYFTIENSDDASQGAYALFNTRLGPQSQDGKWSVSIYCTNLTDKSYLADARDFGLGTLTLEARPRAVGVELTASF